MNKVIILFLICCLLSCDNIELPKSNYCDNIPGYKGFLKISISSNEIIVDDIKIDKLSEIEDFVIQLREKVEACDGLCISAKIYADKDCSFIKLDSVFNELSKQYIPGIYLKTNEFSDSCYIQYSLYPPYPIFDSLQLASYKKMFLDKNNSQFLCVEKVSADSFKVNSKLVDIKVLDRKLDLMFEDSKGHEVAMLINSKNTYNDIIEFMNKYNTKREKARSNYAKSHYNKPLSALNEIEEEIVYHMTNKHLIVVNKKKLSN